MRSPDRTGFGKGDGDGYVLWVPPRFCSGIQISFRLHPGHTIDLCVLLISMDQVSGL